MGELAKRRATGALIRKVFVLRVFILFVFNGESHWCTDPKSIFVMFVFIFFYSFFCIYLFIEQKEYISP